MKKICAIIFDLDGTLTYFKIDFMSARRQVISKLINLGVPKGLISIEQRILTTVEIAENYLNSMGEKPAKIKLIKKQIDKIISQYEMEGAKQTDLIPGARELLRILRSNNYKIGLFTLENREVTNFLIEKCSIKSYFDSIITRDDVDNFKPHPDHLEMVLNELDVSCNEVIVVGDNPVDIVCAKQINAIAIARLSDRHSKKDLVQAGADYIVTNLMEINEILKDN